MRTRTSSWRRSRRRKGCPSRPTSSTTSPLGNGATARSSGPESPAATLGDAAVPAASASNTEQSGISAPADASAIRPCNTTAQSAANSLAHAVDETLPQLGAGVRAREILDRLQRVEPRIGERPDLAPLFDRRAVDLLDLADQERDELAVGQQHRELVDGDVLAPFEHVDADDVAADRADSGRNETERTRSVGKPDAHHETGHDGQVTARSGAVSFLQHGVHKPFSYTRPVTRLGILGGTFDPVHVAHLAAAAAARDQLRLDRVLMVVAGDPWMKRGRVLAPAEARFEMVAAAIDGVEGLEASRLEIDRGGATYTVDTVEALRAEMPHTELFLIVGSDVAASLESWHRTDVLRGAVTLALVDREDAAPTTAPPGWRCVRLHMPRLDVSSTDLRRRIAAGESVDFLVPPPAARVLRGHGLYTGK